MTDAIRKRTILTVALATTITLSGCFDLGGSEDGDSSFTPVAGQADPDPNANNSAPNISGTPSNVAVVGVNWSFTPNSSDIDGDVLTFSITNLPDWAIFEPSNGQLSGAPRLGDSAVYEDIVISVSDGELTASLPAFDINVTQVANGSTTLTWTAPTLNSDGSPLTDLASYRIYYGFSEGSYPNQISVDNPGVTSYVVENLAPATYFFVTTSVNSSGVESAFSNVASTSVN
ncbi:MAG: putative Ig domain-containing protein [Woeseiaceae bacterium]